MANTKWKAYRIETEQKLSQTQNDYRIKIPKNNNFLELH